MGKSSRYKGVSWNASKRKWEAYLCVNGKGTYLGSYDNEGDAYTAWINYKNKTRPNIKIPDLWGEEWSRISFLSGTYYVSSKGRVKNTDYNKTGNEKLLTLQKGTNGYLRVKINKKMFLVHRLVLRVFIGESDLYVNHKDFNKCNNSLENLEYVSPRENVSYSLLKDKDMIGSYYDKGKRKWIAYIQFNGEQKYLGQYDTQEESHDVYLKALEKYGLINRYAEVV